MHFFELVESNKYLLRTVGSGGLASPASESNALDAKPVSAIPVELSFLMTHRSGVKLAFKIVLVQAVSGLGFKV